MTDNDDDAPPLINLTPEDPDPAYQRYGEDIALKGFDIIKSRVPAVHAECEAQRAFATHLYNRHLDSEAMREHIARYIGFGNRLIWIEAWFHQGAGPVLTLVFALPEGCTPEDMMAEIMGWPKA